MKRLFVRAITPLRARQGGGGVCTTVGRCGMKKLLFSNNRLSSRILLAGCTRDLTRIPLLVAFSNR